MFKCIFYLFSKGAILLLLTLLRYTNGVTVGILYVLYVRRFLKRAHKFGTYILFCDKTRVPMFNFLISQPKTYLNFIIKVSVFCSSTTSRAFVVFEAWLVRSVLLLTTIPKQLQVSCDHQVL